MASKVRIIGLAVVALVALSALTASSASAISKILVGGAEPANTPFDSSGELELRTLVLGLNTVVMKCSGLLEGTMINGTEGKVEDLFALGGMVPISELSGTLNALQCTVIADGAKTCATTVGNKAELYVMELNLSTGLFWPVLVFLAGGNYRLEFAEATGKAQGYHVFCPDTLFEQLCGQSSKTDILLEAGADLLATFEEALGVACTTGEGMITGMGDITSTSGALTLSET
jgi:hypothetical protein